MVSTDLGVTDGRKLTIQRDEYDVNEGAGGENNRG